MVIVTNLAQVAGMPELVAMLYGTEERKGILSAWCAALLDDCHCTAEAHYAQLYSSLSTVAVVH